MLHSNNYKTKNSNNYKTNKKDKIPIHEQINGISNREKYNILLSKHIDLEDKIIKKLGMNSNVRELIELRKCIFSLLNNYIKDEIEYKPSHTEEVFTNLKNEIKNIILSINKDKPSVIDLPFIVKSINELSNILTNNQEQIHMENVENQSVTVLLSPMERIPLHLNSGHKILLSTRNANLSSFSLDELNEILRVIDVLAKDDRFDHLRSNITEQIATISTISFNN